MQVKVYANTDDTYVVWKLAQPIPQCQGFAIYRRRHGESKTEILNNRVGYDGDTRKSPQPSTRWPFQRFTWTDYKARSGEILSYRVVPMVGPDRNSLTEASDLASNWTTEVTVAPNGSAGVAAYFNRGIVATQWVSRKLGPGATGARQKRLENIIADPNDATRILLAGELRNHLLALLADARKAKVNVYAALYELNDPELIPALAALGNRAHVILANGSVKKKGGDGNREARETLSSVVDLHDRMTPIGRLAHNKFMVICNLNGDPERVWTGSTNWTKTGLCTQANNGILISDRKLAAHFKEQWELLLQAGDGFPQSLKKNNSKSLDVKAQKRSVRVWFTPLANELDLEDARHIISAAKQGILFLMFNPGPAGSLLSAIIDRKDDPDLLVHGVVNQDPSTTKNPVLIFRRSEALRGKFQVALPAAIEKPGTYWIDELKKAKGWAMVHSKVIVIDPFGAHPVVMTGSHNLGPKASKGNDDNLLIIRGDSELAAAYAVNIVGIYATYRWRYNQVYNNQRRAFTSLWENDRWQQGHLRGDELQELNFWLGT
jgi:phosphatidylserine/phosphatidylglycerophosphate/cardiolipin synthase-like enzyme